MTEKSYGGNNGVREHQGSLIKEKPETKSKGISKKIKTKDKEQLESISKEDNNSAKELTKEQTEEINNYKKAGDIAIKVRDFAKSIIKKDVLLLDIAKKIEDKIVELGGEVAFPVNLSINDIAAHYHPTLEDDTKVEGLLKVDLGIHINGFIADSAFSIDLTENNDYKDLIKASEDALSNALDLLAKNPDSTLNKIGETIQLSIQKKGFR